MKLMHITESPLKNRIKRALLEKGGIFGVMDEFNCNMETAYKYIEILGGGTYGEADIEDKSLHRLRAPQNVYKLLKYFGIPSQVANKIIRFHINNYNTIKNHNPSPNDNEAIRQLVNDERLVAMVQSKDLGDEFIYKLVPWFEELQKEYDTNQQHTIGVWYVAKKENKDILDILFKYESGLALDMLHGLAFGYQLKDIYNFMRSQEPELVDKICDHADKLR